MNQYLSHDVSHYIPNEDHLRSKYGMFCSSLSGGPLPMSSADGGGDDGVSLSVSLVAKISKTNAQRCEKCSNI